MGDAGGFEPRPRVGLAVDGRLRALGDAAHALGVDGREQVFLGREVVVEGARQHVHRAHDVADRRAVKALRAEQPGGLVEEARQAVVGAWRAQRPGELSGRHEYNKQTFVFYHHATRHVNARRRRPLSTPPRGTGDAGIGGRGVSIESIDRRSGSDKTDTTSRRQRCQTLSPHPASTPFPDCC